jgi:hypothetical protein
MSSQPSTPTRQQPQPSSSSAAYHRQRINPQSQQQQRFSAVEEFQPYRDDPVCLLTTDSIRFTSIPSLSKYYPNLNCNHLSLVFLFIYKDNTT